MAGKFGLESDGFMKAEIVGITCSDVEDWETWQPDDPQDVYLGLELSIGWIGGQGQTCFRSLSLHRKA